MLIKKPEPGASARIASSEITPEAVYLERRRLLQAAVALGVVGLGTALAEGTEAVGSEQKSLQYTRNARYSLNEPANSYKDITTYNNFYEFGSDKGDPAANSGRFKPTPWSVTVAGEAEVTGTFTLEDILKPHALEERIYRLRCVEAWSMVIPWIGIPLADLIKRFEPTGDARFVAFESLADPQQMPAVNSRFATIDWPYREGLRM